MYRFFITSGDIGGGRLTVSGPDAHHISHVLRMKPGEDIEAVDEKGLVSTCRITAIGGDTVEAEVLFAEPSCAELPNRLVLFQGLPKSDKMELIIQKAVELGVSEVVPVATARCVVRLDEKRAAAKVKRWQAIAEAAAKQSKRDVIPVIRPVMHFDKALAEAAGLDRTLIPYEKAVDIAASKAVIAGITAGESVGIFIGPEGGFEEKEVLKACEQGASSLTLGPRILRCETAAITILSILMFALTD